MLLRPIAFRIRNFKSIKDSGFCSLSGDMITILAGQNEAGKTSILRALDDFNTEPEDTPQSSDVVPDEDPQAVPLVTVRFRFLSKELLDDIKEREVSIPDGFADFLSKSETLTVTRDLVSNSFSLDDEAAGHWRQCSRNSQAHGASDPAIEDIESVIDSVALVDGTSELYSEESTEDMLSDFTTYLFKVWPLFVYFDSFDDILPRQVSIDLVKKTVAGVEKSFLPTLSQPVTDFILLADIDLKRVRALAASGSEDKQLKNYLNGKSASITGEFLGYWKQNSKKSHVFTLKAEHSRREEGLFLDFYASDGHIVQYLDQRSKGFLWFLSFYLRLAASVVEDKDSKMSHVMLIDEPGSYLHQKAQRDILHVIEDRIAQNDVVIYSTHSPYMIPADKLHRLRVVAKDADGKTFVADRLTDERIQGDNGGDALSPVYAAIGLEIGSYGNVVKQKNIVVEGISDYYYLQGWDQILQKGIFDQCAIIPAMGAKRVPTMVSLCLAWSKRFAILLDNDDAGKASAKELKEKMDISADVIIHPHNAQSIEDILSANDFKSLARKLDASFEIAAGETPCRAIKGRGMDKVLLARKFAELVAGGELSADSFTAASRDNACRLLNALLAALAKRPLGALVAD